MHVGLLHQMWAKDATGTAAVVEQARRDAELAEQLGFDSMMFGEHHFRQDQQFYGRIPMPELLISNIAASTTMLKLGTGVKVLALDKPWRAAEAMLLLDVLTQGRAFFCLGQGTSPDVFPPGTTSDSRRAAFRDHLREILVLLRGGGAGQWSRPLSPETPRDLLSRIWVAVRDDQGIELTAAEGLNLVVNQVEQAAVQGEQVRRYRQAGGVGEARGVRIVVVADTDADAIEAAAPAVATYLPVIAKGPHYRQAVAEARIPEGEPATLEDAFERCCFCVGAPDTVLRRLEAYCATAELDRVDLMVHLPDLDPEASRRTMRLFAKEVAPALRGVAV